MDVTGLVTIAAVFGLGLLATRAVGGMPIAYRGWLAGGQAYASPALPAGVQEDDDFRWSWRAPATTALLSASTWTGRPLGRALGVLPGSVLGAASGTDAVTPATGEPVPAVEIEEIRDAVPVEEIHPHAVNAHRR
jgi:hypothetical protein